MLQQNSLGGGVGYSQQMLAVKGGNNGMFYPQPLLMGGTKAPKRRPGTAGRKA